MEDNNIFGGFEAVVASINNNPGSNTKTSSTGKAYADNPDEIKVKEDDPIIEPPVEIEEEELEEELEEIENEEEEEEEDNPVPPTRTKTKPKKEIDQVNELGDAETEIAEYVQEQIYAKFGFDMGEEKFESIDDVVEFVQAMVEENSKPEYINEEVKYIDEYVRSGGDLKQYMDAVYGGTDLETVNLDNEVQQKELVAEDLRIKGYSETQIKRKLDRMEDAGTLSEEAEDALESLKEYNDKVSEKLLKEQKKQKAVQVEQQQKYIQSVEAAITEMSDIRGVAITNAEKKQLFNYIFKPTADGISQYQKDYLKDNKNLIESAYFTMKGDKLINKVEQRANSNAAKKLKDKLASKGRRGKDQHTQQGHSTGSTSVWGSVSRQLMNNPFN